MKTFSGEEVIGLTFGRIVKAEPVIQEIVHYVGILSATVGHGRAYSFGKKALHYYVGHFRPEAAKHPELRTSEAWDIVIAIMAKLCQHGNEICNMRSMLSGYDSLHFEDLDWSAATKMQSSL